MLREREFLEITDYVSLRVSNMATSSEKIIQSLESTCEMFESLMKEKYGLSRGDRISEIKKRMQGDAGFSADVEVSVIKGVGVPARKPFAFLDGQDESGPEWWRAHNSVKHNRKANFECGNLENALDALAALYFANLVFCKEIGDRWLEQVGDSSDERCIDSPNDVSRLFEAKLGKEVRNPVSAFGVYGVSNEEFIKSMGL